MAVRVLALVCLLVAVMAGCASPASPPAPAVDATLSAAFRNEGTMPLRATVIVHEFQVGVPLEAQDGPIVFEQALVLGAGQANGLETRLSGARDHWVEATYAPDGITGLLGGSNGISFRLAASPCDRWTIDGTGYNDLGQFGGGLVVRRCGVLA